MVVRVAKVVYLIQEASQKCIHSLLGGCGHWYRALDDIETSQAFMLLTLVVWLCSCLISYRSSCCSSLLHSRGKASCSLVVQWWAQPGNNYCTCMDSLSVTLSKTLEANHKCTIYI